MTMRLHLGPGGILDTVLVNKDTLEEKVNVPSKARDLTYERRVVTSPERLTTSAIQTRNVH